MYLPDQNVLILRTPKTNSHLIARAVRETLKLKVESIGNKHAHKDLVGPLRHERNPYTLAFVRHPLDWYAAYWRDHTDPEPQWKLSEPDCYWHPLWPVDVHPDNDFAGFLEKVTDPGGFLYEMYRLYTGRGTSDEIHYVGKTETMLEDFCTVLTTVGIGYDRESLAYLDRNTWRRTLYTDELRARVAVAERETFTAYGYSPPTVDPQLVTQLRAEQAQVLDDVPGWFSQADRDLFRMLLDWQVVTQPPGDLVELGVYMGKSAIVVGEALQPGETFTVCDLFEAEAGDDANATENQISYSTLNREQFERNYQRFRGTLPVIHQMTTKEVAALLTPGSARFVHVDASHLYEHVSVDVDTAREALRPDGIVVFDDYRHKHTPGVAAAVWEAMFTKGLKPIVISPTKWYGTWGDPAPARAAVYSWVATHHRYALELQDVAGHDLLRLIPGGKRPLPQAALAGE